MSLERMFQVVEDLRDTASVDAAFGEPQEVEGRTFIPVAAVSRGFGMGFGQGTAPEDEEEGELPGGEGGGTGGGAGARPVAVIEISAEQTIVRPIVDESKVALAGIALGGWVVFWLAATVRAVFGHSSRGRA
jgi:uncharacterized spore protein YtfJ